MAFFKAKVLRQRKDGMYVVYIRVTQNRKSKYIRTSWVVGDDGLSRDKLDIITPFVAEQTTKIISRPDFITFLRHHIANNDNQ